MRRLSSSRVRGWAAGFGRSMGYPPLRLAGAEDSRGVSPVHAALPEGYENLTLRRPPFFATTRGTWPTDGWSPEAVAMSSSGDFTVVWQYPGDGWFDGTADVMDRILAQRFSRDGERLGEEIAVSGPPILHAQFRQPAIAMDAAGNSIVAWPWIRRGLIIGQRFAPDGQKLGRIFQINVSGPGRDVAIPALNDDGVMAVGYSLGEDAGPQAVATRILDFHAQEFIRGDADDSLSLDITDAVAILDYLFAGGTLKPVWMAGDVNDDGTIELTDAIHLLLYLFIDRSIVIPPPFIGPGFDSTP